MPEAQKPAAAHLARPAKRKKSNTRQRGLLKATRFLPAEYAVALAKANACGLSFSAYMRAAATGEAGPRSLRHLPVDAALLKKVEALLMKYGSNLNQIAKGGNSGYPVDLPGLYAALREWEEVRDYILEALGKKRPA